MELIEMISTEQEPGPNYECTECGKTADRRTNIIHKDGCAGQYVGLDEELLDNLCYILASDLNDNFPPDEQAKNCMKGVDYLGEGQYHRALKNEEGYHSGMLNEADMIIDILEMNGIDVYERARRYVDDTDIEIKTKDELYEEYSE